MTRRALQLTTPTHGVALGAYWLALLLGITFLTPLNSSPAIRRALVGEIAFHGWASSMALCGAVALVAAVLSRPLPFGLETSAQRRKWGQQKRLEHAIRAEAVACGGLAFTFGVYLYALMASGFATLPADAGWRAYRDEALKTLTTKLLAATFIVGGIARAVQVVRELNRWHRSQTDPQSADPAPLADTKR